MTAIPHAPILEALVAPLSLSDFFGNYWPERYVAVHGALSRLPPIFRCQQLSDFSTLADHYRGTVSFGKGTRGPRTITVEAHAADLYGMGLTVYLPDISRCVPGAVEFLRQLERELGLNEGCGRFTAFASPGDDGVSCHFDAEEVFSIQLRGTKRFHVAPVGEVAYPYGMQYGPDMVSFNDLYPQASKGFPDPKAATFETIEMQPGSVLFMPRGTWHRTEAQEDSLSVSIIFRPPSAADCLLAGLHQLLLQDPQWRRPLYGAWGEGSMQEAAQGRATALLKRLPEITAQLAARDLTVQPEAIRLANIKKTTRFQRAPEARIEVEPRMDMEVMRVKSLDGEQIERTTFQMDIPKLYSPLLKWFAASKAAFSAGEIADRFPALTFAQHQEVLQVLCKARFLKPLWFPVLR